MIESICQLTLALDGVAKPVRKARRVKWQPPVFHLQPWRECSHEFGYDTMAYVPAGVFCTDCQTLILQYVPESPQVLGYLSADWAWHYSKGKAWTTAQKP